MKNITVYIPGTDTQSEGMHIASGFVDPVVIKDGKSYYAFLLMDHKSYIDTIKYLVAKRGYFMSQNCILADSCSLSDIYEAAVSAYNFQKDKLVSGFFIDIIDAEKEGGLNQNEVLVKYKGRLFYLRIIEFTENSGTPIHCNPHNDPVFIDGLKNILEEKGYFKSFKQPYCWSIDELTEYEEDI